MISLIPRLISGLLFFSAIALAKPEKVYAPEWTFFPKNGHVLKFFWDFNKTDSPLTEKFLTYCAQTGKCRVIKDPVDYSDNIVLEVLETKTQLIIGMDPGVIEVRATPMTLKQWKKHKKLFQEIIFDNFRLWGAEPHEREGAGHINAGLAEFGDNVLLARNFVADFYNHPGVGIALNSLSANQGDAKSFEQMLPHTRTHFRNLLAEFDRGPRTLESFANTIGQALREKSIAIGIRGTFNKPDFRAEIRTFRPQASMNDFIKSVEILDRRIDYLSKIKQPIPLNPSQVSHDGWMILGEFRDYLQQSGLKLDPYRSLLPEVWRNLPEEHFAAPSCRTYVAP